MYGATEELWFTDWEFKGRHGLTQRCMRAGRQASSSKTSRRPILIIHSELDYRVPFGEGLQLFTAVQRMGIDSKLLVFPDEGHWVLSPEFAALVSYGARWLDKYFKVKQAPQAGCPFATQQRCAAGSGLGGPCKWQTFLAR